MTLPSTQNGDDVVITTASKTTLQLNSTSNKNPTCSSNNNINSSNNCNGNVTSSATAGEDSDLMDLMLTAATTPAASPDHNNNNSNNEITSSNNSRMDLDEDEGEEVVSRRRIRSTASANEDDSDMFGPPRSTPLLNSNRPRVPMISAKLRLREERKRILQLCANKLEKIKDSETNLRRSVCINNTYSRLTEEVRREKQSRYLANLPKCDSRLNSNSTESTINGERCCRLTIPNQPATTCLTKRCCVDGEKQQQRQHEEEQRVPPLHGVATHHHHHNRQQQQRFRDQINPPTTQMNPPKAAPVRPQRRRSQVETDLETLDREIAAMNAAMPPIDPEITQGAEQLEKAVVSRKRTRMEACLESDRFFAFSQIYFPSPRLLSGIDDPPGISMVDGLMKRPRLMGPGMSFESAASLVDFDLGLDHQHQREFEVIMETLRFGPTMVSGGGAMAGGNSTAMQATNATTAPATADSCGHAAMMSEQCNGGGFHSLVVASLET